MLAGSSLYSKLARVLWVDLKDHFEKSHGPPIYKLQRDMNTFCQGTLTITMFHSQLKKKWDEFRMFSFYSLL